MIKLPYVADEYLFPIRSRTVNRTGSLTRRLGRQSVKSQHVGSLGRNWRAFVQRFAIFRKHKRWSKY